MRGVVPEADVPRLPTEKQPQGYLDWNIEPQPPTGDWRPGSYVILSQSIEAPPMTYQFNFGFALEGTTFGQTAFLKTMDLGAIP